MINIIYKREKLRNYFHVPSLMIPTNSVTIKFFGIGNIYQQYKSQDTIPRQEVRKEPWVPFKEVRKEPWVPF
jgi:hypothetical protein